MKNIQIIILEDCQIIAEGLLSIFEKMEEVDSVVVVSTFMELEEIVREKSSQFVFVNPRIVQTNMSHFQQLKANNLYLCWIGILYVVHPDYLLQKLDGTVNLYDSIEEIYQKLERWVQQKQDESDLAKDILSDREIEVLKHIAVGKSNKEIGEKLNISANTVITHRKNISKKTGIRSVSGLTIYAVVQNLISIDKN